MAAKSTIARRFITLALVAGAGWAVALPLGLSLTTPAAAQLFNFFNDPPRRPAPPGQPAQPAPQSGFPFFSPFQAPQDAPRAPPVVIDYSKAPAPRKPETPPTTTIVVMGDSMADWLAYGLEDAVTDMPGFGIVRKHRTNSGLVRYDPRSDLDWPHVVRDILAAEKPGAVVMMVGLNDRQSIRDRPPARGATPPPTPSQDQQNQDPDNPELQIMAPEPPRVGNGTYEFHTERWADAYSRRIDDTIAALKSKGVPVIWVGLPAVRGPKTTADIAYLNDLYRARAEKAGIIYVDVWDGFVDETGKFAPQGPDVEGQIRKLRAGDGVHFTKPGARKLAHYVEREIRRVLSLRPLPMALPTDDVTQPSPSATLRPGIPATRPLAGAVVPLTATAVSPSEELLGGGAARPAAADPIATRVLVKGDALAAPKGRADDFIWPPRSGAVTSQSPPEAEANQQAAVPPAPLDTTGAKPSPERDAGKKSPASGKQAAQSGQPVGESGRLPPPAQKPKPPVAVSRDTPRPPAPVGTSALVPFNWFR